MQLAHLLDAGDRSGARALLQRQPETLHALAARVQQVWADGGGYLWGVGLWPGVDADGEPTACVQVADDLPDRALSAGLDSGVVPASAAISVFLSMRHFTLEHQDDRFPGDAAGARALLDRGAVDEPPVWCIDPHGRPDAVRFVLLGELVRHTGTQTYILGEHLDETDDPDALLTDLHKRRFCAEVVEQW